MTKQEKLSRINNRLAIAIAAEKAKRSEDEARYRHQITSLMAKAQVEREEVANEPEEPQECDQPTVWLNGEQWTCAVVARRILNKLPKLNYPKESFHIELSPSYFGGCRLTFRYINIINKDGGLTSCELRPGDEPEEQAAKVDLWLKNVEVEMAKAQETMREEAGNE